MERSKQRTMSKRDNYENDGASKKIHRSSSPESDEWVEREAPPKDRDDWMSMTGMLKTYTKEDIKPKKEDKDKKHIDSYNPSTSSRELNPHWKNGGTGVPQTAEAFRESRPFKKPNDDDDYYSSRSSRFKEFRKPREDDDYTSSKSREYTKPKDNDDYYSKSSRHDEYRKPRDTDRNSSKSSKYADYRKPVEDENYYKSSRDRSDGYRSSKYDKKDQSSSSSKSGGWRKGSQIDSKRYDSHDQQPQSKYESYDKCIEDKMPSNKIAETEKPAKPPKENNGKYLSDEKMNKLGAKIVKAEIMGNTKLVNELKIKLEEAREYRKQNPNAGKTDEDDQIMLMSTNSMGNTRPLAKTLQGDAKSKGGKRKAETHDVGQRAKYFGDDDKYNLAQMFQQEKYGTNYDNDEELAKVASKSKNPNDDLEDIFTDEISKNRNAAKDDLKERDRAIKQHVKMERSLEGCEHCLDSKNMLKHLMVSCGSRVYLAVPARKSLVEGHCLITTIQHAACVTSLDEDVWEEIMDYRKALTKFFNSQDQDVVFFETATRLHKYPHMVINCVPLPRDVGDMAAIYFKKALLECEAEWAMNKKVIELKGGNVRRGVPKGLPYFWVDFGMDPGFAHVVEDQQLFPKAFAEEIIGGMLDLDHSLWKNPKKEYGDLQRKKVLEFIEKWRSFDTVAKR